MTAPLHDDHRRVQDYLRREPSAIRWLADRLTLVPRIVARQARRFAGWTSADLDDACQEIAKVALGRLDNYHGRAPFDAWLHQICVFTMRGQARRRRLRAAAPLDEQAVGTAAEPADEVAADEQRASVRQAIDAIGGAEAEVLRQRYFEGLDFSDIAERAGIPLATVRTRYYRGAQKLRERLQPAEQNPDR